MAHKDDLNSAYERLEILEKKVAARDKLIDELYATIRELRDDIANKDRQLLERDAEIVKLKARITKVEKRQSAP